MSKYLTTCDLDNTLLTEDKKIKFRSLLYIKKYVKKGNFFVISTGRPLAGAKNYWDLMPKNMPMIADNGASIYYKENNKIISHHFSIPKEIFIEFLNRVNDYILSAVSSYENEILLQNKPKVPFWVVHTNLPDMKTIEGKLSDILNHNPILPNIWVYKENIEQFNKIIDEYKDIFTYRNWGLNDDCYSFEIFANEASKGNALKYLKEQYNIDDDKTISFGDQWNDLSMILEAHYGVAMINAVPLLKEKTPYVTDFDFNHNGVVKYLKKHKLY